MALVTPVTPLPQPPQRRTGVAASCARGLGRRLRARRAGHRGGGALRHAHLRRGLGALALCVHLTLRRLRAKYADPTMLPIVTAINGIGLVIIHRLDLAGGAGRGDFGVVPRLAATALDGARRGRLRRGAAAGARPPDAQPLHVHGDGPRSRADHAAAGPRGRRRGQRRADLDQPGFSTFQPGELAKIVLSSSSPAYLVSARDSLSSSGGGSSACNCRAAATSARSSWSGWSASASSSSSGTSGRRCSSSGSSSGCSTSRPSGPAGSSSACCCSPAAPSSPGRCSRTCRPGWRSGCTRSTRTSPTRATSSSRASSAWPAAACSGAPGWARAGRTSCRTPRPTSSSRRSARSSA